MKTYHVVVSLQVEAEDREDACWQAERECSQSTFVCVESITEISDVSTQRPK